MNEAWIVFGVCVVFILGAALPLIGNRGTGKTPPPPKKEALRDWRREKRES